MPNTYERRGNSRRRNYEDEGRQWENDDPSRRGSQGRGFASMDPEQRRENANRGSRASSQSEGHSDYGPYEGEDEDHRRGDQRREPDYYEEREQWGEGRSPRGYDSSRSQRRNEYGPFEGRGEQGQRWENEDQDYERQGGREYYEGRGQGRGYEEEDQQERRGNGRRGEYAGSYSESGRGEYGRFQREDQHERRSDGRSGSQGRSNGGQSGRGSATSDEERRHEVGARAGKASAHSQQRDERGHFTEHGGAHRRRASRHRTASRGR